MLENSALCDQGRQIPAQQGSVSLPTSQTSTAAFPILQRNFPPFGFYFFTGACSSKILAACG